LTDGVPFAGRLTAWTRTGPAASPTLSEIAALTHTWKLRGSISTEYVSCSAEVLLDGDLVGFIPEIAGSGAFDEAEIVDAIARADYEEPVGRELPEAPPPAPPLMREGGLFRRFLGGFREDSDK
jgi:hypothetical protein